MNEKILLLDDDPNYRTAIKLAFKEKAYTIYEAGSVWEAKEKLEQHDDIRVILLDLNLDNERGTVLLEHLKEDTSSYRVVVLTAQEQLLPAQEAKAYDIFHYQAKATGHAVESLLFTVDQAFKDIEREHLKKKTDAFILIQKMINEEDELHETLNLICKKSLELTGAYTCHIRLFDQSKGGFQLIVCKGVPEDIKDIVLKKKKKAGESFSGLAIMTGQPLVINDMLADPEFSKMKAEAILVTESDEQVREYFERVQSAYIIPFSTGIFEDQVDGVFNINSDQNHFFDNEGQVKLIHEIVDHLAIAVTKHWLKERRELFKKESLNVSEMLFEVSEAIHTKERALFEVHQRLKKEGSLEKIYLAVFKRIVASLNPEAISIFLFNEKEKRLENVAEYRGDQHGFKIENMDFAIVEHYAPGEGLAGRVFSSGNPIRKDNPSDIPGYDEEAPQQLNKRIVSRKLKHYLGSPIKIRDKTVGVIRTVNKLVTDAETLQGNETSNLTDHGFSEDTISFLEIATKNLAVALRDAGLISELNEKVGQLKTLHEVAEIIRSEALSHELLEKIVQHAGIVLSSELCMLFLKPEEDNTKIHLERSHPPFPELRTKSYALGEGKTGRAAETGRAFLKQTADKDYIGKYDDAILSLLRKYYKDESKKIESSLWVPIINKGEILGVIKAINKRGEPFGFNEEDLELLEIFANHIAGTMDQAKRYQKILSAAAERERRLDLLRKLERTTGHSVKHEISTILNYLEVLLPEEKDEELLQIYMDMQDAATNAIFELRNMLGAGEPPLPEKEPLIVQEAMPDLLAPLARQARSKHIRFIQHYPENSLLLLADAQQLQDVFANLSDNSLYAIQKRLVDEETFSVGDGVIKVLVFDRIDTIEIAWEDNGCGIAQEDIPSVFTPFFTKKRDAGTGLGLFNTRNYILQHNGDISVESIPGEGTRFTIRLPAFQHEPSA